MRLQDGGGTGQEAIVDSEGRLYGFATVEEEDKHTNKHAGKVWSYPFTVTPVGAGDYFFYFKNTSNTNAYLTDVRIYAPTAEVVGLHVVSGTASYTAGSDITGVNRNTGSALSLSATVKSDTNTTGLTDDGELYFQVCEAGKLSHMKSSANIVIAAGAAIALKATNGAIALKCMVSIVGAE